MANTDTHESTVTGTKLIGYALRDRCGYISLYDYKSNREQLYRARVWKSLKNVDRYLQTDSYRRLAKHTNSDFTLEEVHEDTLAVRSRWVCISSYPGQPTTTTYGEWRSYPSKERRIGATIRTIPAAEVAAAAALASTRAERRARGLRT